MKSFRPLLTLTGQSIGYGLGVFGSQIISILSVALFVRVLSKDAYGALAITNSTLTLAQNVTAPGIIQTVFRLYNDGDDPRAKRDILGASQIIYVSYTLIIAVLMWIFAEPISRYMLTSDVYVPIVRMLAVILFSEGPSSLCQAYLRIQERPVASSFQNIFQVLLQVALSLALVYVYHMGLEGYWIGQIVGSFIGFAILLWMARKMIVFRTSWYSIKTVFVYSLNFIPQSFSGWIFREFDNFVILRVIGLSGVAVYDIGYRIGQVVLLSITPITVAWPQFIFSRLGQPNAKQLQRDALTYAVLFISAVSLGVLAFAPYTLHVLAPSSYATAIGVIFWSTLGHAFWALNTPFSVGLHIVKKPRYIALVTFCGAMLNVVMNLILIPLYGILGAAFVTFFSYAFTTVVTLMVGQRLYYIPLDGRRLLKLTGVTLAAMVMIQIVNIQALSVPVDLLLRALILLAAAVLLVAVRFITLGQLRDMIVHSREFVIEFRQGRGKKRKKRAAAAAAEEAEAASTEALPGETKI